MKQPKLYPSFLVGQNKGKHRRTIHKMLRVISESLEGLSDDPTFLVPRREPDNPHNPKSVAIYTRDPWFKIGYLPDKHNWVADAMDEGAHINIYIRKVIKRGFFFPKYYVDFDLLRHKGVYEEGKIRTAKKP